jgi:predicted lipoprotein
MFEKIVKMKKLIILFSFLSILMACGSDNDPEVSRDNFNRKVMLENWADNIIIPAYENMNTHVETMKVASNTFIETPNEGNLSSLRQAWLDSYMAWQSVDMFEIGRAEQITLRNFINVYPLDLEGMQQSLLAGNYDLSLINRQDEQGFSALDFLLYGLATSDAEIVAFYTDTVNGAKYKTYMSDVIDRMQILTGDVLSDWKSGYRETFISRDGSSGTESVNSLINDYVFYYEKYLRAGKIGIPAGVFSGGTLNDRVEARFRGDVSKVLFLNALDATQDFFNGIYFNGEGEGVSLNDYLNDLNSIKETEDLSTLINSQFDVIRNMAGNLSDNLGEQVGTNNMLMLETYDELQKSVVLMKVDMLQALNVKVDYVDADGD